MQFTERDIKDFLQQAMDLLEEAEQSLLQVDRGQPLTAHYEVLLRAFHSIKGGSGMLEVKTLQNHMHNLEELLQTFFRKTQMSKPQIDFFLSGIDSARSIIRDGKANFDYRMPSAPDSVETTEPSKEETEAKPMPPADLGLVAIVDDEPDVVDLVSEMLREHGLRTLTFINPLAALEALAKQPVDLLITDYSMPGMNGLELSRKVLEINPEIPVVLISGYLRGPLILENIYALLEKPFDMKGLLHIAKLAIQKHQATRLLNRAIDLLMYQFSDLDEFLRQSGKVQVRNLLRAEIRTVFEQRNKMRSLRKSKPEAA